MADGRKRMVERGYDRMARRYLEWGATIRADPRDDYVARFAERLEPRARVLDLGCGAGVPSTQELARHFRVVGVDVSAAQIALARQNVPGAEFVHADVTHLEFPEASFDGVAALYAVSHVPREQHGQLFADVLRWLSPGGLFLATLGAVDSPDWTGRWLGEDMFFSSFDADTNRRMLQAAGFELIVDDVVVTPEPEGDVRFLWVIARKPSRSAELPSGERAPHEADEQHADDQEEERDVDANDEEADLDRTETHESNA
jgi:ubiquinone/menaquinone biosynthesis C-methylase UbiE